MAAHAPIIGVVVENCHGDWIAQLLQGVEAALAEQTASIAICSLNRGEHYNPAPAMEWIEDRRVDGIVFARAGKTEAPLVEACEAAGIPMAFVAPDAKFDVGDTFRTHNREAGTEVAEHLAALGHRKVAFVGGPENSLDTHDRLAGLRHGLASKGIHLRDADVMFGRDYTPSSGHRSVAWWRGRPQEYVATAVVLGNDSMALGFMRNVLSQGLRVPQDVSVVGFDGVPGGELVWPGLTTAEQQTGAMGKAACDAILERLRGDGTIAPRNVAFDTVFRVRESTGRPLDT